METYLRRGKRSLQRMALDPRLRRFGMLTAYVGSGFFLSGASLLNVPQPIAMGLICAADGWRSLLITLGALVGYPLFWGAAGSQGIVWAVSGAVLSGLLSRRGADREQPLMIPMLSALLTAVTGLSFQLLLGDQTPVGIFFLRVAAALLSCALFLQAFSCRDAITDWLVEGVAVLALAQAAPAAWLSLGYVAAGVLAVGGAFPAAALAGLGLDLSGITRVPMAAVMCLAYFLRMIPFDKKWQHYAAPGFACMGVMAVGGCWELTPLPGLFLGGALGALLPPRAGILQRRGQTGLAQVRLELGAEVMNAAQRILVDIQPPPIDEEGVLRKAMDRACLSCSARRTCTEREKFTVALLEYPLDADCRKAGRLIPELRRAQEQLREMKRQRRRLAEYRGALAQQYRFLGDYLRTLSDHLPRRGEEVQIAFRMEVSARSLGKEGANGDKCLAFPGPGCRYFVLLCDGMGTGLGAAQEGHTAAGLLRQMLTAGFPPEHSLRSLNSLLALSDRAGAVTVDLAEIRLDTGHARLYKWGAAPSWVLTRKGAEKIGTATPPPGISVSGIRETVVKLSLRRGEVLILLSDGVDGEVIQRLSDLTPDGPPGELAAKILESGRGKAEDDATAAVIRLQSTGLEVS